MAQASIVQRLLVPFSGLQPLADFALNYNVTAVVGTNSLLDPLLAANGIMQQFPQHAFPIYYNGTFRLRQRIKIMRVEIRMTFIGAVSNAVLAADLYNTLRVAVYRTGIDYAVASIPYLTGITSGAEVRNVERVYLDHTVSLPSQAYDTTITTPTPQVRNWEVFFEPNDLVLDTYSTNATGIGAAWDTNGRDLMIDFVSDSAIAPNPTLLGNVRLVYAYIK